MSAFDAIIAASYTPAELRALTLWADCQTELVERERRRRGMAPLERAPSHKG